MSKAGKAALIAAIIVAAFLIAVLVIAPRFFHVDRYRPYVVSMLEQRLGRPVSIGHLGLSVFPTVNIRVDNLSIGNPPGFPRDSNWLTVKQVKARLDVRALLHHHVVIDSLSLSQPAVLLLSNAQGRWNYQAPLGSMARKAAIEPISLHRGAPTGAPRASDPPLFTLQKIDAVSLNGGQLTVASLHPNAQPPATELVARGIAGSFEDIDFGSANPSTHPAALPFSATGKLAVKSLQAENLTASNVTSPVQASPTQVSLSDVKFGFYGGKGEGHILLHLSGPTQTYDVQGELNGVDAARLLAAFPQTNGQITGTLASRFTLSGNAFRSAAGAPATLNGEGTVTVRHGRLPKLRIDKTLLQLAHVAEIKAATGDPSAFSLISVDWRLDHQVITTKNVHMDGNGITIDGSGAIHLPAPGRLDYQGVAHIAAVASPLTNILANISGAIYSNGHLTLPFSVTGTLQNPVFRLNMNRMLEKNNPNQAPNAIDNILKLFQRKK